MLQGLVKDTLKLYSNQKSNVKKLVARRRCILSDRCGAGKTISVLFAFSYLKSKGVMKNLLVLTPLSAYEKEVWKKDVVKFTNLKIVDLETLLKMTTCNKDRVLKALDNFDVIYCKHTHIKQEDYNLLLNLIVEQHTTLLCVDEVHACRNPKSALTQLFKGLSSKSSTFWGITATTISRDLENLYTIVNLVSPWYLGPWTLFRDTYCTTMNKVIGYNREQKKRITRQVVSGIKNPDLLRIKLDPIMINGESFTDIEFHEVDYNMSTEESVTYTRIANGISVDSNRDPEEWFKYIMENDVISPKNIGDVSRYSSRFLYLQHSADGIVAKDGSFTRLHSNKVAKLLEVLDTIVEKKQSVLIYCDYLASLNSIKHQIEERYNNVAIYESTGEHKLKEGILTEASVKKKSHIVLCTRASAESASYYFINNVIFFHVPTVPSTFIQFVGRIVRKNTLFPGDLHCYIMQSHNIDLYKLMVVSSKTYLMEQTSGSKEANVPEKYKTLMSTEEDKKYMKKLLLWKNSI